MPGAWGGRAASSLATPGAADRYGQGVRLEPSRDRDQPPMHRIDGEQELLQRDHAEDWRGARLPEYHDRGPRALADPDQRPRNRRSDLAPVGPLEGPLLLRRHAELLEHVPRYPRVRGTGVDQCLHRLEALAGTVPDLDSNSEEIGRASCRERV